MKKTSSVAFSVDANLPLIVACLLGLLIEGKSVSVAVANLEIVQVTTVALAPHTQVRGPGLEMPSFRCLKSYTLIYSFLC